MEYTSRRRSSYRRGIRIIGIAFMAFAVLYMERAVTKGVSPVKAIGMAIAVVFFLVGFSYVKQSFGISAYDVTYIILPEHLKLLTHRGEVLLPYEKITSVTINQPRVDMDYYMIHILSGKYNLVMHVEGVGEKAQEMYDKLIEYTSRKT